MRAFKCNRCKRLFPGYPLPGVVVFEGVTRYSIGWGWTGRGSMHKLDLCPRCQAHLLRLAADKLEAGVVEEDELGREAP